MVRFANYAAGVMIALIFGLSFLFTKGALEVLEPQALLAFRFTIAAMSLSALAAAGLVKLRFRGKDLRPLLAVALFQPLLYFILETIGVGRSATSTAGIVLAAIPAAAALLAIPVLRERPSPRGLAFIALSTLGVAAVALGKSGLVPGTLAEDPLGLLALLGAVAAGACYNVLSRRHSSSFTPAETTFVMMWAGAIVFGAWHLARSIGLGQPVLPAELPRAIPSLLYLGVLSSVLAFFLMNWNLARLEASKATIFLNLVTVVAVAAGWALRDEAIGPVELVGAACILLGVWGANQSPSGARASREGSGRGAA